MFDITYSQEFDPAIHERVRRRFRRESDALAANGFRELCFYNEQLGPWSAIAYSPVLLTMRWQREVVRVRGRLEAIATFLLMSHGDPPTIALPFGLGVKLYTRFTDGTILI